VQSGECEEAMEEEVVRHCLVEDDGLADFEGGGVAGFDDGVYCCGEPVDDQVYAFKVESCGVGEAIAWARAVLERGSGRR